MSEDIRVFSIVDDAAVIIRQKGRFRQSAMYLRRSKPYAAIGNSFVALMNHGVTSDPDTKWIEVVNAPDSVKLIAP